MVISVLIADAHRMFCQGLTRLFAEDGRFLPVGEAKDGLEALRRIRDLKPQVAILDLTMPGLSGLEVAARVAAQRLPTHCLILAGRGELLSAQAAFRAGARGCLLKEAAFEQLADLAQRAAAGESRLGGIGDPAGADGQPTCGLTKRELEVLRLVARGFTSKRIGQVLFISPYTVDSHRQRIMQKLEIRNGPGLVKYAIERGIV